MHSLCECTPISDYVYRKSLTVGSIVVLRRHSFSESLRDTIVTNSLHILLLTISKTLIGNKTT